MAQQRRERGKERLHPDDPRERARWERERGFERDGGSGELPGIAPGVARPPSDEQIRAAIEGVRAMGEWNRTMARNGAAGNLNAVDPARETGGPRGAGYPPSRTSGGVTDAGRPRTADPDEAVARSTLRKRGLSAPRGDARAKDATRRPRGGR